MNGGQIVASSLRELGVERLYSVSGNQILPLYDAAPSAGVRLVHMRHESAAAYAAAAEAEYSSSLGAVAVSAGPAFLAALTGVSVARSYELPLLFLSGHTARSGMGTGGFQDLDQETIARAVCKASFVVTRTAELGTTLHSAARIALDGVPGPVHVALPGDVLLASEAPERNGRADESAQPLAAKEARVLAEIAAKLCGARRPLVVVRPAAARGRAGDALTRLTAALGIRAVVAECPRGSQDLKYRRIVARYAESDFALLVAPADFTVGFMDEATLAKSGSVALIDVPGDPEPRRAPAFRVQADPRTALEALNAALEGRARNADPDWRAIFVPEDVSGEAAEPTREGMHPLQVAQVLRSVLPRDVPIALDGGEFCQWMRLGLASAPNHVLWNSRFGAIGGSLAEAVAMALARNGAAFAISGDGAIGYHLLEFETAVREGARAIALIGSDARWGAEWHIQAERYGLDRTYATALSPAAYEQAAAGLGASAYRASAANELEGALRAALNADKPACINVRIASVRSPAIAP